MLEHERRGRRRRVKGVVVCIVLAVGAGIWHNRATARGASDPVTGAVRTVTAPIVRALAGAGNWIGGQIGWIFTGRATASENRLLRQRVEELAGENAKLREEAAAASRLRTHLGFVDPPPAKRIAADVLSVYPSPNVASLIISRGSRDGVHIGSVAVAPQGLVGHVTSVALTTSVVILLPDADSAVGALVQRSDSRAIGVCKGSAEGALLLSYLDRNTVISVGDAVVSSGQAGNRGIFPKGIAIGTVESVSPAGPSSTLRVVVKPAVDFGRLEEVYILR